MCRKEWAERARRADHGFSVDTACETIDPTTLERAKVSCAVCLGALLFACLACQAAYDLNAKSGSAFSKGSDDRRHAAEGYAGKRHDANGEPCFYPFVASYPAGSGGKGSSSKGTVVLDGGLGCDPAFASAGWGKGSGKSKKQKSWQRGWQRDSWAS